MMYPFMTLNDDTEIACSNIQEDGRVKVAIEKPDQKHGLKSMVCYLPGYEVKDVFKFSSDEIDSYLSLLHKTAHIIMEIAKEGV